MQSRSILGPLGLALACAIAFDPAAAIAVEPVAVAVADFDYIDPTGGVIEQERVAAERLRTLAQQVREGLDQSDRYRVVILECDPAPCSAGRTDPAELLARAKAVGARLLVFGGVQKMNAVIQYGLPQRQRRSLEPRSEGPGRGAHEREPGAVAVWSR